MKRPISFSRNKTQIIQSRKYLCVLHFLNLSLNKSFSPENAKFEKDPNSDIIIDPCSVRFRACRVDRLLAEFNFIYQ